MNYFVKNVCTLLHETNVSVDLLFVKVEAVTSAKKSEIFVRFFICIGLLVYSICIIIQILKMFSN